MPDRRAQCLIRRRKAVLLSAIALLASGISPAAQAAGTSTDRLKARGIAISDGLAGTVDRLAWSLWTFAEVGLQETRSSRLLASALEKSGFRIEHGVAGMPTAFIASYGSGGPVIGILAEYDALPDVGNAIKPVKEERSDGVTNGHGCGHNLFGAASVGAALALKQMIDEGRLKGTIKVFGTPAEEPDLGKLYMAKAGVFDGLDAAIEWHPGTSIATTNQTGLALNNFVVEFFGQASHAGGSPENGRSALDGLELATHGINLLREHVKSTVRIHYAITDGGKVANVVPGYARMVLNVRDTSRQGVDQVYAQVLRIIKGASEAMNVGHKVTLTSALHEALLNRPLQEAVQANLDRLGGIEYDASDQEFARRLQAETQVPTTGYDGTIEPLRAQPGYSGGSSDVAEVSRIAPVAGFSATTAPSNIPWHSWATTAAHGTPAAHKGALFAMKAIMLLGVDLLSRPELLRRAKAAFRQASGGIPYKPAIPLDQAPPLPQAAVATATP
jgi:aminobenzoyl-glutamate utilization protein B